MHRGAPQRLRDHRWIRWSVLTELVDLQPAPAAAAGKKTAAVRSAAAVDYGRESGVAEENCL